MDECEEAKECQPSFTGCVIVYRRESILVSLKSKDNYHNTTNLAFFFIIKKMLLAKVREMNIVNYIRRVEISVTHLKSGILSAT